MSLVELARDIAYKAHFGQADKAGEAYIKHPEKVASLVTTEQEKMVAYLHDVIEDTDVTLGYLRRMGFPENVVNAVDLITKKNGQDYQNYLALVRSNALARVVKLADLQHNSDLSRLKTVTETDLKRRAKYQKAINFLST